ncbi:aldehyde dehydrogenase (NADP(+)) [Pelagicoccus sp. SDUM812005]|uniref:aldehyde dehydrogenase (NADP(+)) n=1 Tax=Pelagicoccus sp. SDUM812005 TaxID=3041257 RepID=UPI00280DDF90|nr:aldehyde dehydrogenase (NADP(+)) [Pelagicoccus sp. SDUM812005]MDQ8182168.1 aldehyde dehydrogenase (NADP(+)) [Pelagicoccus sp. SDUM812005]
MQKILFNGSWTESENPASQFHAVNPSIQEEISERAFPESSWEEIERMVDAAFEASEALFELAPGAYADFLDCYADKIEAANEQLAAAAHEETGLPVAPRLAEVEIPRTINQLRQAAAAARSGDWARPTLDTETNIHSIHGPLGGAVVVFGPNNFPFAYNGIAGGDFASAIAAGNPVIAKAHPAHPYTTQLLAELAQEAATEKGMPNGTVQLFYGTTPENGLKLVAHPKVAAVGFTGSRPGGLALKEAADKAGTPIYLEMSSVNPVFVLPGALHERWSEIATELHGSCTLGAGQFCTKPGLVVMQEGKKANDLIEEMSESFSQTPAGILLTGGGLEAVSKAVEQLKDAGAELQVGGKVADTAHFGYEPTLLKISGDAFLENPAALQSEAFGPVCLVVLAKNFTQMKAIAFALEGNLTGSIYSDSHGGDEPSYAELAKTLRTKVGRLLNDKVPTGVAVSPSMNHGGPYPATGHPGFTAVGFPASVIRFSALHSYDNVREHRLPLALRKKNPSGSLNRLVNGKWTTADA